MTLQEETQVRVVFPMVLCIRLCIRLMVVKPDSPHSRPDACRRLLAAWSPRTRLAERPCLVVWCTRLVGNTMAKSDVLCVCHAHCVCGSPGEERPGARGPDCPQGHLPGHVRRARQARHHLGKELRQRGRQVSSTILAKNWEAGQRLHLAEN